jgi:hypothetical protein
MPISYRARCPHVESPEIYIYGIREQQQQQQTKITVNKDDNDHNTTTTTFPQHRYASLNHGDTF